MGDLPLTILTAVHVGHPQAVRLRGTAVTRDHRVLVSDGLGEVATDARCDDLKAEAVGPDELLRDPIERLADLLPAARTHSERPEPGDRVLSRPESHARLGVSVVQLLVGRRLAGNERLQELL